MHGEVVHAGAPSLTSQLQCVVPSSPHVCETVCSQCQSTTELRTSFLAPSRRDGSESPVRCAAPHSQALGCETLSVVVPIFKLSASLLVALQMMLLCDGVSVAFLAVRVGRSHLFPVVPPLPTV